MTERVKPRGSIILKIIIVLLLGVLVYTIWEPFEHVRVEEQNMQESRLRMSNLRNAQMFYHRQYSTYQSDIDSLLRWIQTDSLVVAKSDSLFKPLSDGIFEPESLRFSPRSHQTYSIAVDDTSSTKRYLIECPDGYGSIGSLTDVSMLHRGSWEY
jgi:hypothetical protein